VGKLKGGGILVINGDSNKISAFAGMTERTFGENEKNDYVLKGGEIYLHGELIGKLNLKVPGRHNRINACGVFAIADALKIDRKVILNALNNFEGTWRRLEYKGKISSGAIVYDDYGHHPTEIKASLEAMRELYPLNNLICVFQPHQFSRTRFFWDEFARSFSYADQVIIPNIYKVRDEKSDFPEISAENLVKEISKYHKNVVYGNGFENTAKILKEKTSGNDVIVIMGAGDVERIGKIIFLKGNHALYL